MKSDHRKYYLAFLLILISFGCGQEKLPESSDLGDLRVLALLANSNSNPGRSEYDPGETVTITPVISDINGTSQEYKVSACIDPGIAFGAEATCENNSSKVDLVANFTAITAPTAADSFTGTANTFQVTLPAAAVIFANRSDVERFNGISYIVIYTLKNSSKTVTSFKRLIVSEKTTKNQNAKISQILSNGVALTAMPFGQVVKLTVGLDVGAETYQIKNQDGSLTSLTESITTSWFISDGDVKFLRTGANEETEFTAPAAAVAGRKSFVIAITRDGRGGMDARIFSQ
jgi:hypothetical protein